MFELMVNVAIMVHFYIIFFMQIFVLVSPCEPVEDTISASVDDNVSFECVPSKPLQTQSCIRMKWTNKSAKRVIVVRPESSQFPDAERVKLDMQENGSNVLTLNNVQKADAGVYSCEVWVGWNCVFTKTVTLKIIDCQHKTKSVAPGSSVSLDCSVRDQAQLLNPSWFLLKAGKPVPLPDRYQVIGSRLHFTSASASDAQWFHCRFRLKDSQERCVDTNLLLREHLELTTEESRASTGVQPVLNLHGDMGLSISGLAVMAGVIVAAAGAFLYWKLCRKTCKAPRDSPEPPEYEDVDGAEYDVAEYDGAEYDGAEYDGAEYDGAEYDGAEYGGAEYGGAEYGGAEYGGADLGGADFGGADFGGAAFDF